MPRRTLFSLHTHTHTLVKRPAQLGETPARISGLSIHASISLLGHFWDTRALTRALEKIPGTARARSFGVRSAWWIFVFGVFFSLEMHRLEDYRACGFRGKVKVIYQVGDLLFKREVVLIGFQIGFQISPQPAGLE